MSELNITENPVIEDKNIVTETVDAIAIVHEDPIEAPEATEQPPVIEAEEQTPVVEAVEQAPVAEAAEEEAPIVEIEQEVSEEAQVVEAEGEAVDDETTSKPSALDSTREALGSVYDRIKVAAVASEEKIKGWFGKSAENQNAEDKE